MPGLSNSAVLRGRWTFDGHSDDLSASGNHGTSAGEPYYLRSETALPQCAGLDGDGNGANDAIDSSPFVVNADQLDTDVDGVGDLCEGRPGVLEMQVSFDRAAGRATAQWNADPNAAGYQLFRSTAAQLRDGFLGTCQNARDTNTGDTIFVDDEDPADGDWFGYIAVGVDGAERRGRVGADGNRAQRDLRGYDCLDY